ncbi:DUF4224 domain-containing protein [Parazoarcus communis]|uniref:DUF4224 domain-containing protein n=1 Tax=Parazoarcus communis SWub3 = DSM 12120 TaxID=1121029 RepID=A0A323UV70_9RHOO|nr:DUF4224 domain-containing protein [Parazoarcus communis SWub3 = DSM 12120]PZA16101.1 hypothetical protein DNK49_13910 [Azoarcus communis] [Parazoarcus communis SWub3 = DSM 12120]
MASDLFLDDEELVRLTGRRRKSAQLRALRAMRIAHLENAAGEPVVPRSAIDGNRRDAHAKPAEWSPAVLNG